MRVVPIVGVSFLVPLNIRCHDIIYDQKGPIIFSTTHVQYRVSGCHIQEAGLGVRQGSMEPHEAEVLGSISRSVKQGFDLRDLVVYQNRGP